MIVARNLQVTVAGALLLDGVSLDVVPGEVVAILGPNGAGKSTLLHALCGDRPLAGGQIWFDGQALAQCRVEDCARRRAVLLQDTPLTFPFTVFEVALMGRMPHTSGREGPRDIAITGSALDAAGVAHLADRLYPTLSGGERRRVQFARALAQIWEPVTQGNRYLFLDEPTANLDLAAQQRVLEAARTIAAEGAGVLAILHDLNLASLYADRMILLSHGRVVTAGTPTSVLASDTIARVFGVRVATVSHPESPDRFVIPVRPALGSQAFTGSRPFPQPTTKEALTMENLNHQAQATAPIGLAARLRRETAAAHRNAERAPFVTALLRGQVNRAGYVALLARLYPVYAALEAGLTTHRDHPVVSQLYYPDLARAGTLHHDLTLLSDGTWTPAAPSSPATLAYVAQLHALTTETPELLLGHAYTRYLGDLSGGQAIARVLQRALGPQWAAGLSFYDFTAIADPDQFKHQYRARIDQLPVSEHTAAAIVDEAVRAFALNRALVDEIAHTEAIDLSAHRQ